MASMNIESPRSGERLRLKTAPKVVPSALTVAPNFGLARKRLGTLALVAAVFVSVYLAILFAAFPIGRIGFPLGVGVCILDFGIWALCRYASLPDKKAFTFAVAIAIFVAWLSSVSIHFGYEARVDRFTLALLGVFCTPFYAVIGRTRIIAIAALMAASQPVVAYWAHEVGFASATPRDLFGSFVGALFALALAIGASELIHATRREAAREISGYSLVRKLGAGGMGEVWEGHHRFLARPAAIKLLAHAEVSSAHIQRFEREAQATALLTSEHTVRLFDFGRTDDERLYYVMELLEGSDLQKLIEERGALSPAHAVHLMAQACDSVGEAHRAGIVHRDLKPSNLFLAQRGMKSEFIKVLDFGLVSVEGGLTLTRANPNSFIGTAAYAPPEAFLGREHDPRSDVYQLGCVMFFLLTGREVFPTDSFAACALAHVHTSPPRPSEVAEEPIPEDLEALVLRCLSKAPDDRPSSGNALYVALSTLECFGAWTDAEGVDYIESMLALARDSRVPIADTLRRVEVRG